MHASSQVLEFAGDDDLCLHQCGMHGADFTGCESAHQC